MICPYCEVEITMSQVDAEDGFCPECGAVITPSSIFINMEDELSELDDLDEEPDILEELDDLDDF